MLEATTTLAASETSLINELLAQLPRPGFVPEWVVPLTASVVAVTQMAWTSSGSA